MKHIFTTILSINLIFTVYLSNAQDTAKVSTYLPFGVYINNPLGLGNKIRVKFEARFDEHSAFLVSMSNYYAIWNGYNTAVEFKHYGNRKNNLEKIRYLKGGWGVTLEDNISGFPNVIKGTYMFLGAGIGQHYTLGKHKSFFIEFTEGLKFAKARRGDVDAEPYTGFRGLFYILGPGAIVDFNINIGWHFGATL